jgi:hypothetical protein
MRAIPSNNCPLFDTLLAYVQRFENALPHINRLTVRHKCRFSGGVFLLMGGEWEMSFRYQI